MGIFQIKHPIEKACFFFFDPFFAIMVRGVSCGSNTSKIGIRTKELKGKKTKIALKIKLLISADNW